jgi:hypothetical protein
VQIRADVDHGMRKARKRFVRPGRVRLFDELDRQPAADSTATESADTISNDASQTAAGRTGPRTPKSSGGLH